MRSRERRGLLLRMLVVGLMSGGFVWLAIEFDPVQSSAQFRVQGGEAGGRPIRGKLLGSLVGNAYTIRIHASTDGPLYSVWDTRSGRLLAEDLPADDVYRHFPDLDPRALHLGPDGAPGDAADLLGPLMTAEQHREELP